MEHLPKSTRKFLKVVREDREMVNWVNSGWWPPKGSNFKIPYFLWDGPAQFVCAPTRPAAKLLIYYAMELDRENAGFNMGQYTVSLTETQEWYTVYNYGLRFTPFDLGAVGTPKELATTQDYQMNLEDVFKFIEKEEQRRNLLK